MSQDFKHFYISYCGLDNRFTLLENIFDRHKNCANRGNCIPKYILPHPENELCLKSIKFNKSQVCAFD